MPQPDQRKWRSAHDILMENSRRETDQWARLFGWRSSSVRTTPRSLFGGSDS